MATPLTTKRVTLDAAQTITAAARQQGQDIGVPMNIAVIDEGNNLVAFARMDGARLGSIDIAQGKAYTARAFDMARTPWRHCANLANRCLESTSATRDGSSCSPAGCRSRRAAPWLAQSRPAVACRTRTSR